MSADLYFFWSRYKALIEWQILLLNPFWLFYFQNISKIVNKLQLFLFSLFNIPYPTFKYDDFDCLYCKEYVIQNCYIVPLINNYFYTFLQQLKKVLPFVSRLCHTSNIVRCVVKSKVQDVNCKNIGVFKKNRLIIIYSFVYL